MTSLHYLTFDDIDAPILLNGCATLIDLIRKVLPGWPFVASETKPELPPFFVIDAEDGEGQYLCQDMTTDGAKPRALDHSDSAAAHT